jgi:signal transduction histidine kinase
MPATKNRGLRFSLTFKLLSLILPLVIIPVAVVGYLSYRTSVESVTHLSRNEQLLQAEVAAAEIDSIFQTCRRDLETLARLFGERVMAPTVGKGEAAPGVHKNWILKLLADFLERSPYYHRISLTDLRGHEQFSVSVDGHERQNRSVKVHFAGFDRLRQAPEKPYLSAITTPSDKQAYILQNAAAVVLPGRDALRAVIIDLDYSKVMARVKSIKFGQRGYAFMVDGGGRIIAHPLYHPYEYDLTRYHDSRLREFVVDMISGGTGWRTFFQEGERAAAYAPVATPGWSLAVSVPISEFVETAKNLRTYVIQIVTAALVFSCLAVAFLSHQILKPVRRLVVATERVADGDLNEEIPVYSNDELSMLTRSFNHMVTSLKDIQTELVASEKLISMGRLSAGVAHEIRNPLNAMKGAIVYLQRRRRADPLAMEYTGIILEEIERLNRVVSEFLSFARQPKPTRVRVHLNELIQSVLNLYAGEFGQKHILIALDLDPSLPDLAVDPQQLEQVLINLLLNAIHAMPDGGQLKIKTGIGRARLGTDNAAGAYIWIADTGSGITEKQLESIFEPFFSTKASGTGLGLPISRGIIEAHGGRLSVSSTTGRGTMVQIDLPIDQDAKQALVDKEGEAIEA